MNVQGRRTSFEEFVLGQTREESKIKFRTISTEPHREDGFAVGVRITHPIFGLGYITHLDGERVTILFDTSGTKRVAAGYVHLADA